MKLLRTLGSLFAWFCVATTFALGAGLVWLQQGGYLSGKNLEAVVGALQDSAENFGGDGPLRQKGSPDVAEPSLTDVVHLRAVKLRDLELREQNLAIAEQNLKLELAQLNSTAIVSDREQKAFETRLEKLRSDAVASGVDDERAILEKMKPDMAKEQLMRMHEEGELQRMIGLLTKMPEDKRAKIINEFITEKELDALAEILKELDSGAPLAPLIEQKKQELESGPAPPAPPAKVPKN